MYQIYAFYLFLTPEFITSVHGNSTLPVFLGTKTVASSLIRHPCFFRSQFTFS